LTEIDRADPNRSGFLEKAARRYLGQMEEERRDARDAAILDSRAEHLNREASDVLEYQNLD
jgi:metal-responsive CopG/Arc/MetJ family transcriptional regulator